MSMRHRFAGSLLIATTVVACGGPPPAESPEQPNVAVDGTGPGGSVVADAATGNSAYDTSPVAAPGELVLHFRWKSPGSTITTAAGLANLPASMVNAPLQAAVAGALDEAVGSAVNAEELAKVVDLDAPLDLVSLADISKPAPVPEPMMAWSVGLTSLDKALEASRGKPEPLSTGVWRVGTQEEWAASCAIAASAGKSPARLVCAEERKNLSVLASYMARNVAAMPEPPGDMRASLNLRGVLDKYGRKWSNQARGLPIIAEELKNGVPIFDKAIVEAANALAIEAGGLIADGDGMDIDFMLDANKGVVASMEMRFAGSKSFLVQSMLDGADKKGPPPEMFWNLPASTDAASYARAGDPARWEPIMKNLQALLEGALEGEKFGTAGDRRAIAKLLRFPTQKYAASVAASGHFNTFPKGAAPQLADVMDSMVGWSIVGVDGDPKEMKAWLNDAVRAYNRPTLQRLFKKEMGSDAKHLPKIRTTAGPRELGTNKMAVEITIPKLDDPMAELNALGPGGPGGPPPPTAKPKTVDVKAYLFLMGDSGRTWIGVASNDKELAKLMGSLKGKTPGANTLSSKREWSVLKSARHNAATVTSLEGFVGAIEPMVSWLTTMAPAPATGPAQQALAALKKMPNRGKTPIIIAADITGGAKPRLSTKMTVTKGTLEDLGYLGANLIKVIEDLEKSMP